LENFAYILILDRLFTIKPLIGEDYSSYYEANKPSELAFKHLHEDDVWLSFPEIVDE
jgi:hypothetical protein